MKATAKGFDWKAFGSCLAHAPFVLQTDPRDRKDWLVNKPRGTNFRHVQDMQKTQDLQATSFSISSSCGTWLPRPSIDILSKNKRGGSELKDQVSFFQRQDVL